MASSELLTAQEAMAAIKCSRSYLSEHADEIGCVRRGGRLLFYRADLERWNERHYRPGQPKAEPSDPTPMRRPTKPVAGIPGSLVGRNNPVTGKPYGEHVG